MQSGTTMLRASLRGKVSPVDRRASISDRNESSGMDASTGRGVAVAWAWDIAAAEYAETRRGLNDLEDVFCREYVA
jgi:hypothetical protein